MSAVDERPSWVRSLEETREVEILSWGGNEQQGSVEWRSVDEAGKAVRNCRRWAIVDGMDAGHHIQEFEDVLAEGKIDIWQEMMRSSAIEFQRFLRDKARERAPKRRR